MIIAALMLLGGVTHPPLQAFDLAVAALDAR